MAAHASDAQTLVNYLRDMALIESAEESKERYELLLAAHMACKVEIDERMACQSLRCGFDNTPDRWLATHMEAYDRDEDELDRMRSRLVASGAIPHHHSLPIERETQNAAKQYATHLTASAIVRDGRGGI